MGEAGPGAWSQGWARGRGLEGGPEGVAPASRFGAPRAERARIRFASRFSRASLAEQAPAPGNLAPASGRVAGQIWTKRELPGLDRSPGGGSGADTGREGAWSVRVPRAGMEQASSSHPPFGPLVGSLYTVASGSHFLTFFPDPCKEWGLRNRGWLQAWKVRSE